MWVYGTWNLTICNILSAGFQGSYVDFLDILSAHHQIFDYSMCYSQLLYLSGDRWFNPFCMLQLFLKQNSSNISDTNLQAVKLLGSLEISCRLKLLCSSILVAGWTNPFEKYAWVHLYPGSGRKFKKIWKPPPAGYYRDFFSHITG